VKFTNNDMTRENRCSSKRLLIKLLLLLPVMPWHTL